MGASTVDVYHPRGTSALGSSELHTIHDTAMASGMGLIRVPSLTEPSSIPQFSCNARSCSERLPLHPLH
jgi:hypothetical protein